MAALNVQFMKLPGWSCAALYFFISSHTAEYPMARSDQDGIGAAAAGLASSLIRNAGFKVEYWVQGGKKRKRYVGREKSPYINEGKRDTLAQRAVNLPHQGISTRRLESRVY
eukprot:640693-Pelagomonas_calceolata.AAC.1